jgi:hypothetical protein
MQAEKIGQLDSGPQICAFYRNYRIILFFGLRKKFLLGDPGNLA